MNVVCDRCHVPYNPINVLCCSVEKKFAILLHASTQRESNPPIELATLPFDANDYCLRLVSHWTDLYEKTAVLSADLSDVPFAFVKSLAWAGTQLEDDLPQHFFCTSVSKGFLGGIKYRFVDLANEEPDGKLLVVEDRGNYKRYLDLIRTKLPEWKALPKGVWTRFDQRDFLLKFRDELMPSVIVDAVSLYTPVGRPSFFIGGVEYFDLHHIYHMLASLDK